MEQPFDGKTLFNVTIEIDVVVLAKDRRAAELLARDEWHEISQNIYPPDATATPCEVSINGKKKWSLSAAWDDSEPYGDKDGKTCKQIIEAIEEYRKAHPSAAELEAMGQQVLTGCK